ncbi:MAG: hypothetical protein LBR15_10795 [Methanobrevibacter sp.]|jgi:hypothetical protein|nr:hypothetical protein [Candidatus Methanovirga australis]
MFRKLEFGICSFLVCLLLSSFVYADNRYITKLVDGHDQFYSFNLDENIIIPITLFYIEDNEDRSVLSDQRITATVNSVDKSVYTSVTGSDGVATFDFGRLEAGNYTILFDYAGTSNLTDVDGYQPDDHNVNVMVKSLPAPPAPKIIVHDKVDSVGLSLTGFNLSVLLSLLSVLFVGGFIRK